MNESTATVGSCSVVLPALPRVLKLYTQVKENGIALKYEFVDKAAKDVHVQLTFLLVLAYAASTGLDVSHKYLPCNSVLLLFLVYVGL